MVREKDQFWKYVKIDDADGVLSCKFCEQVFSGVTSISRIKSHLAGVRGRDVKLCTRVSEDVKLKASDAIKSDASKKKAKSTKSLENVEETASVSCPSSSLMKGGAAHQSNLPNICNKEDKSAVDDKLVKFIISNHISLDVIQKPSFIDFVTSVTKFGCRYELPSPSSVRTKLDQILEDNISEYVDSVKKSFAVTGCTMMYYKWYDLTYFFACTPRGMVVIEPPKCSINEMVDVECLLSHTIETLGPKHVTQLLYLGDLTRPFIYPQTVITTCASYQIRQLVRDIYNDNGWVDDIFSIARTIVAYIHKHNVNLLLRRDHIRSKKVACLRHNKFVTDFLKLPLILQVENDLQALQLPISSLSCTMCDFRSEDEGTHHAKFVQALNCIIHNNGFWGEVREVVRVLQPIYEVVHLVDDYRSTSGYLYEAWKRARDKLKECMGKNPEKYEPIWQKFNHCQNDLIRPIYKAAAFLNPAYMPSENFMEDIEIKEGVDYVYKNLVASEDKEAFETQIQQYRSKEPWTFTTTAKTKLRTTHPRKWWQECCGDHLPVLRKYAIRILSQPCSLFPCQQNTRDLSRSDNPILDVNKRLMEKYSILGAQDEGPIKLDKLSEFLAHGTNELDIEEWIDDIDDEWETVMSDPKYEGIMARWSWS